MSRERFLLGAFLASSVLLLPLYYALWVSWPVSTDIVFYGNAIAHFSQQFWAGDYFPRWMMDMNDGLGSPVFVFYPPVAFYFSVLLQWLSALDPYGLWRVAMGMQAALLVAGITAYCWFKQHFSPTEARRSALIYMTFPGLALPIYFDFGLAQIWAIAWLPLLLIAVEALQTKRLLGMACLALAYALLAATHLPTLLVFGAIPVIYAGVFAPAQKRFLSLLCAVGAAILGAGLDAYYLLPTQLNHDFITTRHFTSGNGDYEANFSSIRNLIGATILLLPFIAFFVDASRETRRALFNKQTIFWFAIMAGALFMTSMISKPIWDLIPPLKFLQFPWRMLIATIPAGAFILALWWKHLPKKTLYYCHLVIVFGFLGTFCAKSFFFESDAPMRNVFAHSLVTSVEYQTKWMREARVKTYPKLPAELMEIPPVSFASGDGSVNILEWSPRRIALDVDITTPEATILLRRFYFPNWFEVNGNAMAIPAKDGLMGVMAEQGQHQLVFSPSYEGEWLGRNISLICLCLCVMLFLIHHHIAGGGRKRNP